MTGKRAAAFPEGGRLRLLKKVRSSLGPLCEGAPAGGGGENCTAARNISGYGKVLSIRPFGALAGRTTAEALVAERQREAYLSLYGHPLLRFTMNEVRSAGMLAKKLQTAGIRQTALPTWLNEVEL